MRVLAFLHFALLYLFHFEICATSETFSDLESWFDKNVKGQQDTATTDILIMLCLLKVKREIQPQQIIASNHTNNANNGIDNLFKSNIGNIDITNTNTLENTIQLPPIKIPNITVVIVEDELAQVARTRGQNSNIELANLIRIFKECMNKKLGILGRSAQ